ncbi:TonB-dependent receptor [Sphingomonas sp. LB-2]|uniref:TonB-dependent receptor n=1 Tax=Sphingomonas caeni TaxID=2984949 RepID=UPI00222F95A1|nr:TonB-dependent receptor [Sphingomonas caeni]MCW3847413.1 TonB-dependent receptor [Sphingomonas caeni]
MGRALRSGASVLALGVMAAASPAFAQDDKQEEPTITVTGIRASLTNSQNIKRNSDTVVDAITASDIGALPDRSVTEALQRVPGVAMNRFAGSNDPDHFSAEGSGVVVRGLTFVRSEFNGRDVFAPGVYGQSIGFQDVPADMLGSVEVYKNSTAELVEGGLSGTVNMNLRKPFDRKGFFLGFSAEAVYTDMRQKWSPVVSVVASDTWDTGIGRIGILGAISYSKLFSRADGVQVSNFQTRDGKYAVQSNTSNTLVCRNALPGSTDTVGFPPNVAGTNPGDPCYGPAPAGANGFADYLPLVYAPLGGQFRSQEYDRTRRGYAAAFQWESLDRRAVFSASFLRSHATTEWGEWTFEAGSDLSEYNTYPKGCRPNTAAPGSVPRAECPTGFTNYQYDSSNIFENGYITLPVGGWRGNIYTNANADVGDKVPGGGMENTLTRRMVDETNIVNDLGWNLKFTPNERWAFNFDGQHIWAKRDQLDFSVTGSNYADQELDLRGNYPVITPHKPQQLGLWATWSQNSAVSPALAAANDAEYFGNPRYTFWRSAMDHIESSTGQEWSARADVQFNFLDDVPFLKHIKFGARYADRDQQVRYTTYNWGSLSETWSGNAIQFDEFGTGYSQHDWGNFFRGQTKAPPVGNFYNGDLIDQYGSSVAFFQQIQGRARLLGGGGATSWVPLAGRPGVLTGTPFLPSDIQPVSESNWAGYAMLSFGSPDPIFGGVTLDGNIGVRYVSTRVTSGGSIGAPTQQSLGINLPFTDPDGAGPLSGRCDPVLPPLPAPQVPQPQRGVCLLGAAGYAALQSFANGATFANTAVNTYDYFLPSINLKFGLTDNLILRLAAGRNMARPAMQDIRNFLTIGGAGTTSDFQLTATAGNPFLKPAISDNFDAGLEWYFGGSRVGSLTLNLFAKNIHNFFYQNISERQISNNGQTYTVFVRGPANYGQTGKVRGFEVAYSQTYDFLPGFLSGFGLSANYTYIDSTGLSNSQLFLGGRSPIGTPGNLPLEQLSKHNFNIQPFYEKGPISIRVAYSWRSKFLLTASDVIFPYYPIYNAATGTLDATVFLKLTDNFKIGVQGVNLTNEVTQTLQQFTLSGLQGPRSYFMNDRRVHLILRGSF